MVNPLGVWIATADETTAEEIAETETGADEVSGAIEDAPSELATLVETIAIDELTLSTFFPAERAATTPS